MKMTFLFQLIFILIFTLSGCSKTEPVTPDPEPQKEDNHPFLIVKKEQFPALREKASQEPWKSMKADAIARSAGGSSNDPYKLQEFVGAAALAYILDESNATTHANRVRDAILTKYAAMEIEESSDWGKVTKPLGSFFAAILALDVVYNELSAEDIQKCENVIESKIFKVNRKGSWQDARYGTHGTWDIYKGDRTEPDNSYYNGIMNQITTDGVSPVTNHYAWERVGGGDSRLSKSGYMDVLEFTGIDKRYYNNEQIAKFYRWLFGSSINCNKEMAIIGDMLPTQGIGNYLLHRRVVNFDMEAAGYAAWYLEGKPAPGHLLTYVVPQQALPDPVVPSSKIYTNGGAFFRDSEDNVNGLHGVLYNIKTQAEWHTHNEVNGLALSALGNRLLVNGGRLGEPVRAAYLNNTLTINGENHNSRTGGGILGGFTSESVGFAVGDDGPAMSANHKRNLILVHTSNEMPGYFVVFDEVEAKAGEQVKMYLHPANQTSVTVAENLAEYIANLDHYPTVGGSAVDFYYLTPPQKVNIEKVAGAVPDRYPGYPDHNRLEAVYNTSEKGSKNLATLIFPINGGIQKPVFEKISGDGFNACSFTKENISDFIFESENSVAITSGTKTFAAKLVLCRENTTENLFYFVKDGTSFKSGKVGFEADSPVSIVARKNKGEIISEGATVKLFGDGIENINFSPAVESVSSGNGFVEVKLPAGNVTFN